MAKGTRAIQQLRKRAVDFTVHEYEAEDAERSYGEAVAAALGVDSARVFKTLVATVDGRPTVAIIPVSGRLSLKKLAGAAGGKRATMAEPSDAERLTGYVVGGISPFGQQRRLPTLVDDSVSRHSTVFVSAGRRGLQLELAPGALIVETGAVVADVTS